MIHSESRNTISIQFQNLLRLCNLYKSNFKRQFRCDDSKGIYNPFQSFRSYQCKWLCPVRISHSKKQSRKSTDMISMIMSKADHIDWFKTPASFFNCNLRTFSAVDQQTAAVISCHQRSQPSSRKGHHPSTSKQT